jgi:hypothetical protein
MAEVFLEYVINERGQRPGGLRIMDDGEVLQPADSNSPPEPTARLDKDRSVAWETQRRLSAEELETLRTAVQNTKFFELPPQLLINYCKEDPGTAIWKINIGEQSLRVVVFDPRPKRSADIDSILAALKSVLAS